MYSKNNSIGFCIIMTDHFRIRKHIMSKFILSIVIAALLATPLAAQSAPGQITADILIAGGSFSDTAAALAAARTNPNAKILLTIPDDWAGGQSTVQGVAAIDNAHSEPAGSLMRNNPPLYYAADYLQFLNTMKNKPVNAPGSGMAANGTAWVSREAFDPRTGAWVLDQMLATMPNITVMKMTVPKMAATRDVSDEFGSAKEITTVTLIQRTPVNGYVPYTLLLSQELKDRYTSTNSSIFSKQVFEVTSATPGKPITVIDCSETGDIIVPAGAEYTVGRELTTEDIADDGTLPAYAENASQATVFTFCMTGSSTPQTGEESLKSLWSDFDSYYTAQKTGYFSFSTSTAWTWQQIWTYRRLRGITGSTSVAMTDVSMQNWFPGNDYPYGSIYLNKSDAASQLASPDGWFGGLNMNYLAEAEKHAVAWYFYMKERKPETVSWNTRYAYGFSDPDNMMSTALGLSKFPYIRCCRRILGLENFRLMNRYFINTRAAGYDNKTTSFRFYDSVGIGNYPVDIHPIKNTVGLSPSITNPAPFYIPYRALASKNIRNLLAAGKQEAGTFLTNAAYRLHPIEWAIGSAAGTAAGLMSRDHADNMQMLELPRLRELQTQTNANSPISWATLDTTAVPPKNGDLIVNNFNTVKANVDFRVEVYYFGATTAQVFLNDNLLGETSVKSNGRFLLNDAQTRLQTGTYPMKVDLYSKTGTKVDTLSAQVAVQNDTNSNEDVPIVIDNSDPGFTTTGTWTVGISQPNKYGESYTYSWGSDPPSTCNWTFTGIKTGSYTVQIWYPEAGNRSTQSSFTIKHAGGSTVVNVNQQANGGAWYTLGKFNFTSEQGAQISLSNTGIESTSLLVVADACRICRDITQVHDWSVF